MAVVQLANQADVIEQLGGRGLTPEEEARLGPILDKLSELFRLHAGQTFSAGTAKVRRKVDGGLVFLPQRPVTAVESVTDDHGCAVPFARDGQWLDVGLGSHRFVRVRYTHGGDVPDLVRLTIADAARQILSIDPKAVAGVTQGSETGGAESISNTYATWAVGGATRLSPEDIAIARTYRTRAPRVTVMRP